MNIEQSDFMCFPSSWVSHAPAAEGQGFPYEQELVIIIIITAFFPSVALTPLALAIRGRTPESRTEFLFCLKAPEPVHEQQL